LLHEAAARAEQSGDLESILEVAHTRAILRDPTQLAENLAAAEHFLELAECHPEAAARMRYRSLRGFGAHLTRYLCALTACDLDAADLVLDHCQQITESAHVRTAQFVVSLLRAGRALGDGRLLELQRLIPSERALEESELPMERAVWHGYKLALGEAQNDTCRFADAQLDQAGAARVRDSRFMAQAAMLRARRLALGGELARSRAVIAQIPQALRDRMPVHHGDLGALCALAEVLVAQGDLGAADMLYDKLLPYASLNAVCPAFDYRGAVGHFLGLLARLLDRQEAAAAHFQRALQLNRKLNMPRQLAWTEQALQQLRTRSGR
jgi:hypothetical protein